MMTLGTVLPYLKKIQKLYKSRNTPFDVLKKLPTFIQPIKTFPTTINLLDLKLPERMLNNKIEKII